MPFDQEPENNGGGGDGSKLITLTASFVNKPGVSSLCLNGLRSELMSVRSTFQRMVGQNAAPFCENETTFRWQGDPVSCAQVSSMTSGLLDDGFALCFQSALKGSYDVDYYSYQPMPHSYTVLVALSQKL